MPKTPEELEKELEQLRATYEGQIDALKQQLDEETVAHAELQATADELNAYKRQKIEERVHAIKPDYDCDGKTDDYLTAYADGLEIASPAAPESDPDTVAHGAAAGAPSLQVPGTDGTVANAVKHVPRGKIPMQEFINNMFS